MADEAVPRGLPTLDRDVHKLLFRNIVAQKAIWNGAGTIIAKLAATNKTILNAIGHVTNEFCTSTITSQGMTLKCDDRTPSIVVTRAQFVWLVKWDMLHLKDITIACRNAREKWRPCIDYFDIPSLETLRYVVPPDTRKLIDNTSAHLAADIVKVNASTIKELHGVPLWKLAEPLTAYSLRLLTCKPRTFDDLHNLSGCVVDELEVDLEHCSPDEEISLDALDEVNVKKIVFNGVAFNGEWDRLPKFGYLPNFTASEGRTNEHVRHLQIKIAAISREDMEILHGFLPNMTSVHIDTVFYSFRRADRANELRVLQQIAQYLASDPLKWNVRLIFTRHRSETSEWTVKNVRDEYATVQKVRDAIAQVPPQLHVRASVYANFYHAGDAETKEANKVASELGFSSRSSVDYAQKLELGPGRELRMQWMVNDRGL